MPLTVLTIPLPLVSLFFSSLVSSVMPERGYMERVGGESGLRRRVREHIERGG